MSNYNDKQLDNIVTSLKYWEVSDAQKDCVRDLVSQIKTEKSKREHYEDLALDHHYQLIIDAMDDSEN